MFASLVAAALVGGAAAQKGPAPCDAAGMM